MVKNDVPYTRTVSTVLQNIRILSEITNWIYFTAR